MKFIIRHDDKEYEFPLSIGLITVGRDPACDVVLDSKKVSRRHLSCMVTENEVIVRDLGSRNGFYVGGVLVKEARLSENDELKVGDFKLIFNSGVPSGNSGVVFSNTSEQLAEAEKELEDDDEETPAAADEDMLLPAVQAGGQPQLVEQDGKLFVLDPGTGRKVEIVPVQTEISEPAITVSPAGLPRRSRRMLIIGLAAVVLVLVLAAIVKQSGTDKPEVMSAREYHRLLDDALMAVEAGDIKKAGGFIETAIAGRPKYDAANILKKIALRWSSWRKEIVTDSDEMEELMIQLNNAHNSHTCLNFTKKNVHAIHRAREYSYYVSQVRKTMEKGELEKSWTRLQKAGKLIEQDKMLDESNLGAKHKALEENLRKSIVERLKTEASSAEKSRSWKPALDALNKLRGYDPDNSELYSKQIAEFESHESDRGALARARRQFSQNDYSTALNSLRQIEKKSPYDRQARSLELSIRSAQRNKMGLALYRNGNAERALAVLKDDVNASAVALATHIQSVLKHRTNALEEKKNGNLEAEQLAWTAIEELEQDPKNKYRLEALRELGRFRSRFQDIAGTYLDKGREFYRIGRFVEARQLFEKAKRSDPDGAMGKDYLDEMTRRARLEYNRGIDAERQKDVKAALRHYEQAAQLADPEDDFHDKAKERIARLQK